MEAAPTRSTIIARTRNSVYEVDLEGRRVRRLTGDIDPTPEQGRDGEWRRAEVISTPEVGEKIVIVWSAEVSRDDAHAHTSVTSTVQDVSVNLG